MSLGQQLHPHLPFLRRYARALTGSQNHGDAYVRAALEAIVAAPEEFPSDVDPRLGLYKTFQAIWSSSHLEDLPMSAGNGREAIAQARLARLTPLPRQALLLTALEGFTVDDVSYLIDLDSADVEALVEEALGEIEAQTRAKVLIIEDEPIIAMDIETIVRDLGHGRRQQRYRCGEGYSGRIFGAGDLHHRLPGTTADRRTPGAHLPHHQAVPACDGEGRNFTGAVL
jgi:DNA-directed RNA polymerase specialized sigma24 family protein